jgi:nucleotide-binding universal stress UspA family protein
MSQRPGAPPTGTPASTYKRILVPLDGSRAAEAGLREAIRLAAGNPDATIRLLHVLEPLPPLQGMEVIITETLIDNMTSFGEKILQKARAAVESRGLRAETVFRRKPPQRAAEGITAEIRKWKADIVVMGTHGRRGLSRVVLGSDAETVVRMAAVPVVLVRADPA